MALPQNRYLRASLLIAVIAIILGYSWLGARLLEPRFELPEELVRASVWVTESRVSSLHDVRSRHWRELARIESEISTIGSALRWLGGAGRGLEPVELVVHGDRKERLVVTGSRIEISADVLMAHGQLTKAFLKSFVLQTGSSDLVASHLRLDVASDVLLAMSTGRLGLEVPGHDVTLSFEPIKPWWTYSRSYRGVCDSEWRSVELLPICRAKDSGQSTASMLSFRPLLGTVVWNAFASQPVANRYAFARKWARFISRARAVEGAGGTKERILTELETLMPSSEFPEAIDSIRRSLSEARLIEPSSLEADLLLRKARLTKSDVQAIADLLRARPRLAVFARTDEGLLSFPGAVLVDSKDLMISTVKHEVALSCQSMKLLEAAKREVPTTRLIWVKACGEKEIPLVFAPLLSVGMEGFARANPTVSFVQLRPESVALALRRGHASAFDGVEALVRVESQRREPWFGLQMASWVDSANAYRVNGAIEAVEWHRTAKAPKVSAEF